MASEYQEIAILMIVCAVFGIAVLIQYYRAELRAESERERAASKAHNDKWSKVYAARLESDNRKLRATARTVDYKDSVGEEYTCDDSYCSEVANTKTHT